MRLQITHRDELEDAEDGQTKSRLDLDLISPGQSNPAAVKPTRCSLPPVWNKHLNIYGLDGCQVPASVSSIYMQLCRILDRTAAIQVGPLFTFSGKTLSLPLSAPSTSICCDTCKILTSVHRIRLWANTEIKHNDRPAGFDSHTDKRFFLRYASFPFSGPSHRPIRRVTVKQASRNKQQASVTGRSALSVPRSSLDIMTSRLRSPSISGLDINLPRSIRNGCTKSCCRFTKQPELVE